MAKESDCQAPGLIMRHISLLIWGQINLIPGAQKNLLWFFTLRLFEESLV